MRGQRHLKARTLRASRCHAMESARVEEHMFVSAMRLFNPARWPGDDMALRHIILLSFAYVFESYAHQEVQSATWVTGNTLAARETEQHVTISEI